MAGAMDQRVAGPSGRFRTGPNDPEWPTDAQWAELARSVGGGLTKPEPLVDAIAGDRDLLTNPYFVSDQPGGTQMSGWLGGWSPKQSCYAVLAESAEEVAIAVRFADRYNIRLVVKGGGHSMLGTSNAPDSLLVWTRKLSDVTLHDAFVPQGAGKNVDPVPAASFGGGCILIDAYTAVTTQAGRFVQAGECPTVGLAGLVANGGFGNFSKRFGTAASNLLEAEVVTADGRVRRVNAYLEPDLFWALKGGGGGAFAVITQLTLRTHDLPESFGGAFGVIEAGSRDAMVRLVDQFLRFFGEHLDNPQWGGRACVLTENRLDLAMYCQGLEEDRIKAIWAPFSAWVKDAGSDYDIIHEFGTFRFPARKWWDFLEHQSNGSDLRFDDRPGARQSHGWWAADSDQIGVYVYGCDSIWMTDRLLADPNRLAEGLVEAAASFCVDLHFGRGLGTAEEWTKSTARDTATNPVMLKAFALAVVGTHGSPRYPGIDLPSGSETEGVAEARNVRASMQILRRICPEGGSYISESDYFSDNWRDRHWGTNAERLARVKEDYDPGGLFEVHHGIGSAPSDGGR